MSVFAAVPEPTGKPLARYRNLSPKASVHVSPLCLGAMSIGDKWNKFMGSMDKEQSFALLDAFWERGGNFIDTANNYQMETSEMFIGEWAEARGIRDQLIIATKYTTNFKMGQQVGPFGDPSFVGNGMKSMHVSVAASLKKLRTTYIDILYIHWWDYETSIEEVMNGLHNLVVSGKVLYLGISDTPAWIVSEANRYALMTGKTPFSVYQGQWSILSRSFERDIIPMARAHGMALAPWGVVGGGKLRSDKEEAKRKETGEGGRTMRGPWERNEDETKVSRALEKVAGEVGVGDNVTAVAIAYVMHKTPFVFPIIGGRKIEHLDSNIEALNISLSKEQIAYLESVIPFDAGFPNTMIGDGTDASWLKKTAAYFERVPLLQPIQPAPKKHDSQEKK